MKPRYKERVILHASVVFSLGPTIGEGRVLDLTSPGCLIESPVAVKKGNYIHLKMFLPGLKSPLTVKLGAVRWAKGTMFGVEFLQMEKSEQQVLNAFLAQHLMDVAPEKAGRRAFSEPAGRNWHLETHSIAKYRRTP